LVVELTADGYIAHGVRADVAAKDAEQALLNILPHDAAKAIPIEGVLAASTLGRTTVQTVIHLWETQGSVGRVGAGKKGDPHRYYLRQIPSADTSLLGEAERIDGPDEVSV
jgi:hypothetical protein